MGVEGNVHQIVVPTPLPLGSTNLFLINEKPITLIDTGPDTDSTLVDLKAGLAELDLDFKDIERIVLTHGHVDHCGLAYVLQEMSDLEVLAHENDRDIIEDFSGALEEKLKTYVKIVESSGVPPMTFQVVKEFLEFLASLTHPCKLTQVLKDGDKIEFENDELKVIHTPGHSSGSASYMSGDSLFAGDALVSENSPCAVFGGADKRSIGLADFLESMDKLSRSGAKMIYPGHGEPFEDIHMRVEGMRVAYQTRKETILGYLEMEELTAFELMNRLFANMSIEQVIMGLGETLGHLEILVDEKAVTTEDKEGLVYYKV
jgi:glyoxylase-like metal-dependent hydrolase (beta-lactamase superfamily II)